jgi:hypothetical protein
MLNGNKLGEKNHFISLRIHHRTFMIQYIKMFSSPSSKIFDRWSILNGNCYLLLHSYLRTADMLDKHLCTDNVLQYQQTYITKTSNSHTIFTNEVEISNTCNQKLLMLNKMICLWFSPTSFVYFVFYTTLKKDEQRNKQKMFSDTNFLNITKVITTN